MPERVTRFLVSLSQDVLRTAEFGKDPDHILAGTDLTEEQKVLLKSGDARRIRNYLGRDLPIYAQQSQSIVPPPEPRPDPGPKPDPNPGPPPGPKPQAGAV
jgi:hypothetical protein